MTTTVVISDKRSKLIYLFLQLCNADIEKSKLLHLIPDKVQLIRIHLSKQSHQPVILSSDFLPPPGCISVGLVELLILHHLFSLPLTISAHYQILFQKR